MKFLTSIAMAASVTATTVRIDVGQNGLAFTPNNVTAAKGDLLEFHFHAINHSVVMGDFSNPCQPAATGGFFSGFMPTSSGENANVFQVEVNSTDPIFFYCSQNTLSHCKSGMSGVVNPSADQSLATYQKNAQSVASASNPASVFGGAIVANSANTASPSTSSSPTGAAPAPTTSCGTSSGSGNSGGGNGYRRRDNSCPTAAPSGKSGASSNAVVSIAAVFGALGLAVMMA